MLFYKVFEKIAFCFLVMGNLRAAGFFFRLFFEDLVRLKVNINSGIFSKQEDLFKRKAIGVFQFKSLIACDLFKRACLRFFYDLA